MPCILLRPEQKLAGTLPKDRWSKTSTAYIAVDRNQDWALYSMSLPILAAWINDNLSSESCEKVSATALFRNLNRTDGRHGGWVKGKYRVTSTPMSHSKDAFEAARSDCKHAAIVGHSFRATGRSPATEAS
jgi:hypothetical protein|eukprot:3136795-Prymnesium_polylepis.2